MDNTSEIHVKYGLNIMPKLLIGGGGTLAAQNRHQGRGETVRDTGRKRLTHQRLIPSGFLPHWSYVCYLTKEVNTVLRIKIKPGQCEFPKDQCAEKHAIHTMQYKCK